MKYFIPKDLVVSDSSIAEHTDENGVVYPAWAKADAREKGSIVSHSGGLFEAFTNIYPMATYIWNDVADGVTPIVTRVSDGVLMTPTAVPCVLDETVVYVQDTWKQGRENSVGKYFIYIGVTGNVDFTTIDPADPSLKFDPINNFRHEPFEPLLGQNTVYWRYIGRTNRNKVTDKSYNSQSVVESTTEVWWEFEILNPDKITMFNLQAPKAKIIVYTTDILTPLYENTIDSLLDTTSIINWRTLSRYRSLYTKNASWKLPFITGQVTVRIVLSSDNVTTIKAGEILAGEEVQLALTLDGVPTQIKSSGKIEELENGDIILRDEGDITKIYLIYSFTLLYDTITHDKIVDKCSNLINRRIVIEAEDSDSPIYRSLVFYGFVREASPTLVSNSTKSEIKISAQRFK